MDIKPSALSLCLACAHCQRVVSGKGSQFLLCRLAVGEQRDERFAKYPRQPVVRCEGYVHDAADEALR